MSLSVPLSLSEVTPAWTVAAVCSALEWDAASVAVVASCVQNRDDALGQEEGVFSRICRAFVHLERKDSSSDKPRKISAAHSIFIKLTSCPNQDIVLRHRLFQREITIYRDVLPLLTSLWRSGHFPTRSLLTAGLVCSALDPSTGNVHDHGHGCIVLEDLSVKGFRTHDNTTMLLGKKQIMAAVLSLSEFHGLCIAHDILEEKSLVQKFPILQAKHLLWFQDDMVMFLESMVKEASLFLDAIPGEQETARRLYLALGDPRSLFSRERSRWSAPDLAFRCVVHGDVWHNNVIFRRKGQGEVRAALLDWQTSYEGSALSDVCFLLYSSTTSLFRRKYADVVLAAYFERLVAVVRGLGVTNEQFAPTLQECKEEFQKCLKFCLLFCASAEDLKMEENQGCERKASIAEDSALVILDEDTPASSVSVGKVTPASARAIRRRNFLDNCREAVSRGVI